MVKKAEIEGQIFVYILTIVVFSLILLYGYRSLTGIKEKTDQVSLIKFKTDLTSAIKRIAPDFGTLKKEEFFIGGEFRKICFVQSFNPPANLQSLINDDTNPDKNPLISDSVQSRTGDNTFLLSNKLEDSFNIGPIEVNPNGYLCLPFLNGKVKVSFLGKGDRAEVSAP
ncbi:hypothetical protein HYU13_02305 [Candidatus Woesearchaeota archaeon]|nr:hypothetical protein [Candidatus Woesearchaeota archaeon]